MLIFSIKNEKLGFFNRPIYCESSAEALSYIQNILMSDADRALSGLKDDLSLYCLASIDFQTGYIHDNVNGPDFVCTLRDIFDTIPEDKLKPALTRDDLNNLSEKLSTVDDHLKRLEATVHNHTHPKKGGKCN